MTYEMRMKDIRNDAFAKGEATANFNALKNIMTSFNISIDKAMDVLKTPQNERQHYKDLLAKGM